jgi:hypothetical protein
MKALRDVFLGLSIAALLFYLLVRATTAVPFVYQGF